MAMRGMSYDMGPIWMDLGPRGHYQRAQMERDMQMRIAEEITKKMSVSTNTSYNPRTQSNVMNTLVHIPDDSAYSELRCHHDEPVPKTWKQKLRTEISEWLKI